MQIIQERDWTYIGQDRGKFVFASKKDEGTELHTQACKVIALNKRFVAYLDVKQSNKPIALSHSAIRRLHSQVMLDDALAWLKSTFNLKHV